MNSSSVSKFDLNRHTLSELLRDKDALDLHLLRDVTENVEKMLIENKLPKRFWSLFILTGSAAAFLAGVGSSYSDIDLFTYENVEIDNSFGKIEFVIKKQWREVFSYRVPKEKEIRDKIFASLIIHLFDLDCCRFVCIPEEVKKESSTSINESMEKSYKWNLYTCLSGKRFLEEKINYVDRYNARSLKVHSRIQKYKERGFESHIEMPDRINQMGDIYAYVPKQRENSKDKDKPNIVFDNRDLLWFIQHQHGIELHKSYPWYEQYLSHIEDNTDKRQVILDLIRTKLKSPSKLMIALLSFLQGIPDNYIDDLERCIISVGKDHRIENIDTSDVLLECRYSYAEEGKTYAFFPIVHKKKVYWIRIIYRSLGKKDIQIENISFYAYEEYKNYNARSKAYNKRNLYRFMENLTKSPLPKEVYTSARNHFRKEILKEDLEESSSSSDEYESE